MLSVLSSQRNKKLAIALVVFAASLLFAWVKKDGRLNRLGQGLIKLIDDFRLQPMTMRGEKNSYRFYSLWQRLESSLAH